MFTHTISPQTVPNNPLLHPHETQNIYNRRPHGAYIYTNPLKHNPTPNIYIYIYPKYMLRFIYMFSCEQRRGIYPFFFNWYRLAMVILRFAADGVKFVFVVRFQSAVADVWRWLHIYTYKYAAAKAADATKTAICITQQDIIDKQLKHQLHTSHIIDIHFLCVCDYTTRLLCMYSIWLEGWEDSMCMHVCV